SLRVNPWLAIPFGWNYRERKTTRGRRLRTQTRVMSDFPACETLEGRVVLSGWGNPLAESLTNVGVVLKPIVATDQVAPPWAGQNTQLSQLQTDRQTLQTELQGLAAKSGVTVADLTKLNTDAQAIAQAGFRFDPSALQ